MQKNYLFLELFLKKHKSFPIDTVSRLKWWKHFLQNQFPKFPKINNEQKIVVYHITTPSLLTPDVETVISLTL